MAMSVIRTKRGLVKPAENTPRATLELSAMDKIPVLRCNARTLHVFRNGPEAAKVIKDALSRALVPYYALAGRLAESKSKPGSLQIECTGDGVWFVEACTDCNLQSVNFFDDVVSIPYDDLLPDPIPDTEGSIDPLIKMQVTQFGCGGFVIGLIFCHTICDGLGAAQFLNAVGELARGLPQPTIQPLWHRHFFPSPSPQQPEIPKLPLPPIPNYKLEHANIDIPIHQITNLKHQFHNLTGTTCSSFEVVAAALWSCRTKSIQFEPTTQVKLVFFANCRHLLDPPLPTGFYGNCFFPVTITSSSESFEKASVFDVVKMIQEAKAQLAAEFGKYLQNNGGGGEDPFAPPLAYTTLFISEWGRLGFNHVDYQWGPPVHVVPIQGSSVIPVGIVGYMPLPNKGIRLMTWCVEQAHRGPFLDHFNGVVMDDKHSNQELI